MSTITANYTDPKLETVRNAVGRKSDGMPFLLLPVRVETRFMKVEKPQETPFNEDNQIETTWQLLAESKLLLGQQMDEISAKEIQTLLKEVGRKMDAADQLIGKYNAGITSEQRSLTTPYLADIQTLLNQKAFKPFASRVKNIRTLVSGMQEQLEATKGAPEATYRAGADYLREMKDLELRLLRVQEGKIPYTRPIHKKDLYIFTEKLTQDSGDWYRSAASRTEKIQVLDPPQWSGIQRVHENIKQVLPKAIQVIGQVHRDKNWNAFIQTMNGRVRDMDRSFAAFEKETLPRLEFLSQIDQVAGDRLFHQHLQLLENVTSIKIHPDPELVQREGKRLKKSVKKLARQNQKLIRTNAQQFAHLQSVWTALDNSIRDLGRRQPKKVQLRRNAKDRNNPFFQKKLNLFPEPAAKAYTPKLSLFENKRLEELYGYSRQLRSVFEALIETTRKKNFDPGSLAAQLEKAQQELQRSSGKQIFISRQQQSELGKGLNVLRKQVKAGKLPGKDKKALYGQLEELQKTVAAAGTQTLKSTAGQYRFAAEKQDAAILPTNELVDELWVRIFPDDLFVNTHEQGLTPTEEKAAQEYWKTAWSVNEDDAQLLSVWRMLCAGFGKNRAAWIVRSLDPAKVGKRNVQLFDQKPTNYLYQTLPDLEWLVDNLVEPDKATEATPHPFDDAEVLDRFDSANKQLGLAVSKVQYISLAEQCRVLSRNIYSKLYSLDKSLFEATEDPKQTTKTDNRNQIVAAFLAQQQYLADLKVLSFTQYLQSVSIPFEFPKVASRPASWSEAPHTKVLPDQFAVITRNGNDFAHIVVGNRIPEKLAVGMDPALVEESEDDHVYQLDENGNLIVEEGIRWMTDFEEAVKVGMGVKIPLSSEEATEGFDQVLVLGLKQSGTKRSQQLLEELLENHHYGADGLEFIRTGTPSNNTEEAASGYSSDTEELDAAHALELGEELFDASATDSLDFADGKRVADALGIAADYLQHIKQADGREISNALTFNRCLSYATVRDYMEEMMDSLFTQDNIQRTHAFFNESVIARGALPAFRIGNQPYGILPTSAFSRYQVDNTYDENNLPPPTTEADLQLRFDIRLKQVLSIMQGHWTSMREAYVNHAERLAESTDPQQEFMDMLGLHANFAESYFRYGANVAYRGSETVNEEFIGNYQEEDIFTPIQLYYIFQSLIDNGNYEGEIPADNVSHFEKSRLFRCRFLEETATVLGGYVDDAYPVAETAPLPEDAGPDYINWLLEQPNLYEVLQDNTAANFPSRSILFLLLRQAFLVAYREVAMDIVQHEELIDSAFRRIIGSSDHYISPEQKFRTKWSYLMLSFTINQGTQAGNFDPFFDFSLFDPYEEYDLDELYQHPFVSHLERRGDSVGEYLFDGYLPSKFPDHQVYFDQVDRFRDDFSRLADLSSRELDQLLREHLDLCYYRLDAWILGLFQQRLQQIRTDNPTGILLGAYAWVENLRPGGARTETQAVPEALREEGDTIYLDEDNQGFIHAPSINQAVAAAVLRCGYQSNSFEEDINNSFAVNLSSFRVRKALTILSGIANGQELSAVLGYQFEKGLHERYREVELDQFIVPFRNEFPLTVPIAEDVTTNDTTDSLESNVVNALDLLNKLEEEIANLDFAQQSSLYEVLTEDSFKNCPKWLREDLIEANGGGDTELTAIISEIDQLADAFDAIGDLVTSESVYQIVQGNHVRAAAIVKALADGKAIPDPQIVYTPRSGTLVNHRIVLSLDPNVIAAADGWTAETRRSKAAPAINYWLGQLLGAAETIKILVRVEAVATTYSLDDLAIQPVDLLYLIHPDPANPNHNLQDLIRFKIRKADQLSLDVPILIDFEERDAGWDANAKTIYELQPLAAQLKALINDAKPLSAEDLTLPVENTETEDTRKQDLSELVARMEPAREALLQLGADIALFLEDHPEAIINTPDFAVAKDYLLDSFFFGVPNTLSDIGIETTPEAGGHLLERLQLVSGVIAKKQLTIDSILAGLTEDLEVPQQVNRWIRIGKEVFGAAFPVIPKFTFEDTGNLAGQLGNDPATKLNIHTSEPLAMDTWLQGMSKVRDKMAALEMQRLFLELDGREVPALQPVQLPFQSGDFWLGLDYPEDHEPAGDKLSLVTMNASYLTTGTSGRAGLVLDEWTELIPSREEVSGISFNYDQPDAVPPQSLLLAVSPKQTGKWDWDDLVYTLLDTITLAKNRAVEPDHLEQSVFGQILPAIVSEVVPPQVAEDGYANPLGTQVVMDFLDNLPPVEEDAG